MRYGQYFLPIITINSRPLLAHLKKTQKKEMLFSSGCNFFAVITTFFTHNMKGLKGLHIS